MRLTTVLALLLTTLPAAAHAQLFDNHVHLWEGEKSLRDYEAQAKTDGVEPTLVAAMWFGGPNQALAGHPDQIRAANDAHWAMAKRHRNILPVATVHPYDGESALSEVDRLAKLGYRVLKIHAHTQKFDAADPRVLTLVQRAGANGLTVLMDNAGILPGDCEKLLNLALAAPRTRFIFAHLGGMNFRFWNILRAARTAKGLFADNIYFDISATPVLLADSPINDEFVWTMRSVGIDHILIGSDYPQYSLRQNLDAIDRLPLTPEEKDKIRYGNAKSLFKLTD